MKNGMSFAPSRPIAEATRCILTVSGARYEGMLRFLELCSNLWKQVVRHDLLLQARLFSAGLLCTYFIMGETILGRPGRFRRICSKTILESPPWTALHPEAANSAHEPKRCPHGENERPRMPSWNHPLKVSLGFAQRPRRAPSQTRPSGGDGREIGLESSRKSRR
jgi:hypothetical protein